jgi:heptose I phosphotransferase
MTGAGPDIRYGSDGTAWNAFFENLISRHGLHDFDAMMQREDGEIIKHAIPQRKTVRLQLPGCSAVYLKRHYPEPMLQTIKNALKLDARPTAFDEFKNIIAFHRAGLPTVVPIAAGHRHGSSFLVTEALDGCTRLDDYLRQTKLAAADKAELTGRVAGLIQKMHAAGFNHRDLYLCHILTDSRGNLYIVDLHRVQRRGAVPERWRVKDVAALNYSAPAGIISRTDRLRFLKAYLGTERLSGRDRRFALKVFKKAEKMVEHNKKSQSTC